MKLGFIGTGVITEAIITGLLRSDVAASQFIVSARGLETSERLAQMSPKVRVCGDNQDIVDAADIVFLAVLPQIAEEVLRPLQFRAGQQVASLIATLPIAVLHDWIGADMRISRAIPLPPVAEGRGVTALLSASDDLRAIFDALGRAVAVETVEEFDALACASALMGSYFGVLETAAGWLGDKGMPAEDARAYLGALFSGLAHRTVQAEGTPDGAFEALRVGHSTPGGLNQQLFDVFSHEGGAQALTAALDAVYDRVAAARR